MEITETSKIGEDILNEGGAILLGLSIKNSYFKDENIERLIQWSSKTAKHVYIMIPDTPAAYTLMSFGYDEKKARTKAKLEANRLENKCKKIIEECSTCDNVTIVRWDSLIENEGYKSSLAEIEQAYQKDDKFHESFRSTTREVIESNGTKLEQDQAINIGVNFLIQELAFISAADKILGEDRVAYLYHKTMPVFQEILEDKFLYKATKNVGFITAR